MLKIKNELIKLNSNTRIYNLKIPVIAITGGIASGKTTVSQIISSKSLPLISADTLVKEIYQQIDVQNFIAKNYPETIIDKKIDFKKLRAIFFEDENKKNVIEKLIYQHLEEKFNKTVGALSNPSFIIYDVPLLFEKDLSRQVDIIICVYTKEKLQLERLLKRDNISIDLAQKILKTQIDIEIKKTKSHFIIENNQSLDYLINNIDDVLAEIFLN